MPEILLPTKAQVETINTKVGTNVDAGGTTTLFARLKQIYDNIVANLGSNADPSSATGSVHAKLKDIRVNTGGTDWSKYHYFSTYRNLAGQGIGNRNRFTPTLVNTYQPILSITGKGFLSRYLGRWSDATVTGYFKITLDGIALYEEIQGKSESGGRYNGYMCLLDKGVYDITIHGIPHNANFPQSIISDKGNIMATTMPLFFSQSCLIEVKCSSTSYPLDFEYAGGTET